MRWRIPLHAAGLALCLTATGLSSSHRLSVPATRFVANAAVSDPETLRSSSEDDGFARDDGFTRDDDATDAANVSADPDDPASILPPIELPSSDVAQAHDAQTVDAPDGRTQAEIRQMANLRPIRAQAAPAEPAPLLDPLELPAEPAARREPLVPPMPLTVESAAPEAPTPAETTTPTENATPAEIAAQEDAAELIPPSRAVTPAEPMAEQPQVFQADGIAWQQKPLTTVSRDVIRRAAKRDSATPDYAAAHFNKYPCVAYGPTRSPEGIPTLAAPTAGDFCYQPLFFEQKNLERYGRSHGVIQPVLSGARFFVTIPALPYLASVNHPWTCYDWQYPYPAGFPAPRIRELPRPSAAGGLVQTGIVIGMIFLIP